MTRTKSVYLALLAVLLSPMAANADVIVSQGLGAGAYSASSVYPGFPVELAFDGNPNTNWNSGSWPPGWIEVNLGQAFDITMLELIVAQAPAALTTHEIWVSNSAIQGNTSGATLAYTLTGVTSNQNALTATLAFPITAQFVQVRTDTGASPSWVAWYEIQVHAAAVPEPGTLALLGLGLAGMGMTRRKKKV